MRLNKLLLLQWPVEEVTNPNTTSEKQNIYKGA